MSLVALTLASKGEVQWGPVSGWVAGIGSIFAAAIALTVAFIKKPRRPKVTVERVDPV
jgi:hypothetical protein